MAALATICVTGLVVLATLVGCDRGSDSDETTKTSGPEQIGATIDAFFESSATGYYDPVRAVLVVHHGDTLVERYYDSDPAETHNVFSVTKSVMSTLVGIAISEGELRIDQSLGELLPEYRARMTDEVAGITLEQLLTMTAGLAEDPTRGPPPFMTEPDWVGSILTEPLASRPGEKFAYSSAGSHLLSAILEHAVRQSALAYARPRLFDPLGIDTSNALTVTAVEKNLTRYDRAGFAWPTDPQGIQTGFNFLKITPSDMAAFGEMFLNDGQWRSEQIVPKSWVQSATTPIVDTDPDTGYGYQWWTYTVQDQEAFAAMGHGGQVIQVLPESELVVVTACNVDDDVAVLDQWALADTMNLIIMSGLGP